MRTIVALLFVSLAISLWAQSVAARGEGVDLCKLMRCKCKLDKGVPKCVDGPEECKAPVKPVKPGMQWPVCASNGKTYRHPAEVAYEACKTKNPLKIESWKKCSDSKPKTTRGHENTPSRRRARLPPHKSSRRRTRLHPHKGSRRRTRLPPHKGSRRRTRLPPHKGSRRRTRLPSRKRSLCSAFTRAEPHCKCQLRKGVPKCVDDKGKESCPLMMDRGFVMKPVTGDNGKHYQNLEFLALDSCKTNTPIKVKAPKEARH